MIKFFCLFFVIAFKANAGHEVGNGGHIIKCANSDRYYNIDYVIEKNNFSKVKIPKYFNLEKSLLAIGSTIQNKVPELAQSFHLFIKDLKNTTDFSKNHIWLNDQFAIDDTTNSAITSLPGWCRIGEYGPVIFQLAILRLNRSFAQNKKIEFHIDYGLLKQLDTTQLSFLIVHEWLWEHSSDTNKNRKINYYLHTKLFIDEPTEVVRKKLKDYGLPIHDL